MHLYEVRPRSDHRGFDLISDVLPFGRSRNRLRDARQPISRCRDSRLRRRGQRDRNARARRRFQGVVSQTEVGNR